MIKKNYTIPRLKKYDLWRKGPWAESTNIGSSEGGMGYVFVHRNLVSCNCWLQSSTAVMC